MATSAQGGRPVWDDLASPEDVELLDHGTGGWDDTPDVLVVGGGIVGLAIAAFCHRAQMRVLLVERDRVAGCASGRAAGGLGPDVHPELGDQWHALAKDSFELHRALEAEWGYGLRVRDVLVPPDLRIPEQGLVDPVRTAAAFARRAGTIATSTACTDTHSAGGRIVRVVTDRGDVYPGNVVFATGTGPPQAPGICDVLVKGHLIATAPVGFDLDVTIGDGDILVGQLADGRLIAGGTKDRDDWTTTVDGAVVERIRLRMSELEPRAAGAEVTHAWCCFRPRGPDELPVIDRVPGLTNAFMAAGLYSTGILMAPVVGRLVGDWIGGGRPAGLEAFRVKR